MDIFQAIADPTRRSIVAQLKNNSAQSLANLCVNQSISRQAISKHLKILVDADIVITKKKGRNSLHTLNPIPLKEIAHWLEPFAILWDQRLSNLQSYLGEQHEK
jgi:DNA-binding transcriptional ArsR family regulator